MPALSRSSQFNCLATRICLLQSNRDSFVRPRIRGIGICCMLDVWHCTQNYSILRNHLYQVSSWPFPWVLYCFWCGQYTGGGQCSTTMRRRRVLSCSQCRPAFVLLWSVSKFLILFNTHRSKYTRCHSQHMRDFKDRLFLLYSTWRRQYSPEPKRCKPAECSANVCKRFTSEDDKHYQFFMPHPEHLMAFQIRWWID